MSFQHQHLAKLIHEASTIALRRDLEKDLEVLVKRMEAKAEQISKIQRHRARLEKLKVSKNKQHCARDSSKADEDKKANQGGLKRKPSGQGKKSLQLLRDMQSIQSSLQKDDVSWDC
ncbi:centrosomal protein of 57 kDa [Protobothrops mucrosquamatus]|nr:centrosomal protein of 57 kDa [Protobothrops mucrosquamatus]